MNATPIVAERATSLAPDTERATLLGLGPLVRKDFREWLRGKRAWITPLIVAPVLALTAANGAINQLDHHQRPEPERGPHPADLARPRVQLPGRHRHASS